MFLFSETSFELLVEEGSALLPIEISGIGAVSTSRPSYKDMTAMMDLSNKCAANGRGRKTVQSRPRPHPRGWGLGQYRLPQLERSFQISLARFQRRFDRVKRSRLANHVLPYVYMGVLISPLYPSYLATKVSLSCFSSCLILVRVLYPS